MAIVQISKITQRAGNLVDLPQLDNGEFGWATDTNRLFIGKTGDVYADENIEVLTSYSNISFSQIAGSDGGNFNISAAQNGQILTYVSSTDTWENYSGNTSQFGGTKLQLGSVSNISMTGGAIGYVLETDGLGNLSWTPKNALITTIIGLTNNVTGNIVTMTVANTTPYTNGQSITISGGNISNSSASANINGQTFYVEVDANFGANSSVVGSGNVVLYTDIGLITTANGAGLLSYTTNTGIATAVIGSGGGGSGGVGGANTSVQFNDQGVSNGIAGFTFNKSTTTLTVTSGNIVSGNLNATSLITAPVLVSNIAIGTAPLTVTSTTQVANLSVATAGSATTAGTVTTAAQPNITSTGTLTGLTVSATITGSVSGSAGSATTAGTVTTAAQPNITSTGTLTGLTVSATITGSVSGSAGSATTAGTVTTAAQPNITSVGTLLGLEVAGNITPSANITYNLGNNTNRFNDLYLANSTIYIGTQTINANSTSVSISGQVVANILGNISGNAETAGTVTTAAQPNITSVGTLTGLTVSATITGSVSGSAGSATTAGTVTTAAQPNITSTGTLTSLSVTGNVNVNTGTPVQYDTDGSIISGRLLGRYANRSGNINSYFADYNGTNSITSPDALRVASLGINLDSGIGNSNISMALGTNYGSKAAGLAFVSGTSQDVITLAAGGTPLYTGNVNAVMLGYPTVGPRILVQDYALIDSAPNVITYIANTHSFNGNVTVDSLNNGQLAGLRNRIINGAMSVWQYWTTVASPTSGSYLADRWFLISTGTAPASATQSTNVPNAQSLYSLLVNGSAGNTEIDFSQRIESLNMYDMSGQVVTVSAWVYSSDSRAATVQLIYPTATDNFTSFVTIGTDVSAAATGWRKISYQYTVPAQQFGLQVNLLFGAVGAGISVGIAQVQVEIGSVATTFEQRSFGLELSLCQRYYVQVGTNSIGVAASSTIADVFLTFPVTMRTVPTFTALDTSVDIRINGSTASYAGAWASLSSGVDTAIVNFTLASGSWPGTNLFVVNTTPVIAASAEI